MFVILTALLFAIIVSIIVYVKYTYNYWQRNGILQMSPSFPFGNVGPMLMKTDTFGHSFRNLYEYFKTRNQAVGGYYFVLKPELIIVDMELIKCILAKDFPYFMDRGVYIDEQNDPLSAHLFALPGAKWKTLRAKLTPTFTSGKMKMMFPTLLACSRQMESLLENLSRNDEPIDMKDILSRFTIDVIGSCAFGIDCNSMKDPDNEFRNYGIAAFNIKGFDTVRQMLVIVFPKLMQFLKFPGLNPKINTFFMNVVKDTISYREKNNVQRNDFLQLLLDIKNQNHKETCETDSKDVSNTNEGLTLEQIAAQCFVFFLAGFDTSSTTMTFSLFEMASNQEIQDKVRDEILTVLKKYNGQLTYEGIMELHYLDKVICETLRKYPPLAFINREVTMDYIMPGTECTIKKGTPVVISVEGVHWDPEYYPNPEKFDPERFSLDEKIKRPHYSYLPFGEGPRICIGLRFGLMQTKVGLASILMNFKCSVNGKTKLPIVMTPESILTTPKDGIWLDLQKIIS